MNLAGWANWRHARLPKTHESSAVQINGHLLRLLLSLRLLQPGLPGGVAARSHGGFRGDYSADFDRTLGVHGRPRPGKLGRRAAGAAPGKPAGGILRAALWNRGTYYRDLRFGGGGAAAMGAHAAGGPVGLVRLLRGVGLLDRAGAAPEIGRAHG